jgi:alkylation response protein AidB-like acyl-CoA dehydrogenase
LIDFEPSEEQALVIETVHQFAENEIRPAARESDEAGELPKSVLEHAHELGLVANSLAESAGGGGERSAVTAALVLEELAWGDLSIALGIVSPALCALPIQDYGSAEQQSDWLPGFTAAKFAPGSLAIVEPRFDANVLAPETRAGRNGAGWSLSGQKCFVPWLPGCEAVLVAAACEGGPCLFRVPAQSDGLRVERESNLGTRGLPTVELQLEDVTVPDAARLANTALPHLVQRGRVALAAAAVGVARAAYETALEYAKERETFGAPIATRQAIAFKLADMAIEIDGARLLTWEAAWRFDNELDAARESTLAWQQASRVALEVADGAVQVLGGHGYIRDYLPEMHLRNARGFAHFEALALV